MKLFRLPTIAAICFLGAAVFGFYFLTKTEKVQTKELASLTLAIEDWDQQNLTAFSSIGFSMGKNLKKADLRSVVFVEFPCENCGKNFEMNKKRIKRQSNLGVIYKLYPSDTSCNAFVKNVPESTSCNLSYLALCAQQNGLKDEKILNQMFVGYAELSQKGLSPKKVIESMQDRLNVNAEQYSHCKADPKINYKLQKMIQEASPHKALVLPEVYVQNRYYVAGKQPTAVESLYDELIQFYSHP